MQRSKSLFLMFILVWAMVAFGCSSGDGETVDGDAADGDVVDGDAVDGDVVDGDDADGDEEATDGDEGYSFIIDRDEMLGEAVDDAYLVEELNGEVAVAWDEYGVPHIYAEDVHDAAMAMGYIQADQRMFQMDFFRRVGRGKLSGLFVVAEPSLVSASVFMRTVFSTPDGGNLLQEMYDIVDQSTKDNLQAYADGVNLRLQRYREDDSDWPAPYQFPAVLLSPDQIDDWEPLDTIAIARYQTWDLSSDYSPEIERSELLLSLGEQLYNDLIFATPATDVYIQPEDAKRKSLRRQADTRVSIGFANAERWLNSMRGALDVHQLVRNLIPKRDGSNNWAGATDSDGITYLCNDPHLSLYSPPIFMPTTMDVTNFSDDADELHVGGVAFPGTPAIVIGRTDKLAWGDTVVGYDVMDVYAETVTFDNDGVPLSVLFEGNQVDVVTVVHEFINGNLSPDDPLMIPIYFVPHHGPFIPGSLDPDNGTGLTLKWTGMEATKEIQAVVNLQFVDTVDEAFVAIDDFGVGAQNYMLADTEGNIGWDPHANVPLRDCDMNVTPPWMILPGEGGCEWTGAYIPDDELPQSKNPSDGYIITANNDPSGDLMDGDPTNEGRYLLWDQVGIGYRALGAKTGVEDLIAAGDYDWQDMVDVQFSFVSHMAMELVPIILDLVDRYDLETAMSAEAVVALGLLEDWDYDMHSGLADPHDPLNASVVADEDKKKSSAATTYFNHFFVRFAHDLILDELQAAGVNGFRKKNLSKFIIQMIRDTGDAAEGLESAYYDDVSTDPAKETAADILLGVFESTVTDVLARKAYKDGTIADAMWGRTHTLTLENPIAAATSSFNYGPFGLGGGAYTVNPAGFGPGLNPENQDLTFTHGPAVRFTHEVTSEGITTHYNLPGGVNGRQESEHYGDLMELWMSGETTVMEIEWEKVKAAGIEKMTVLAPTP